MKMTKLKQMCRERGLNDSANSKLHLMARLLPFILDVTFDSSEDHEIVVYLAELGLDKMGSKKERIELLEKHMDSLKHNTSGQQQVDSEELDEEGITEDLTEETLIGLDEQPSTPVALKKRIRSIITPSTTPHNKVRVFDNINLNQSDLDTLNPEQWINDNIIDFCLKDIPYESGVYILNSQFYPLIAQHTDRCIQRILQHDVFCARATLLPVCANNHWILFIIQPTQRSLELIYCDSLATWDMSLVNHLTNFLQRAWKCRNNNELNNDGSLSSAEIHINVRKPKLPQQSNSFDCGLYVLMYARKYIESLSELELFLSGDIGVTPDSVHMYRRELKQRISNVVQEPKTTDERSGKQPRTICKNLESIFEKEEKKTFTQKQLDIIAGDDSYPQCSYSFDKWTMVKACDPSDLDAERRSILFLKSAFKSHGMKRSNVVTSLQANQIILKNNSYKWPNPLTTGKFEYVLPQQHGRSKVAMFEIFECSHPLCSLQGDCTAQWKWEIRFGSSQAHIYCKGKHTLSWKPTDLLKRGLSVTQKKEVLNHKQNYPTTCGQIALAMKVNSRVVTNFVQHFQRSKRLAEDHFEAFKLRLQELKEQEDMYIVTPNKTIDDLTEQNFSVLILSKNLVDYAVEKGLIFDIIGHDGVYKLTDRGVPVNIYCTVTKKDFRGIVLGCSIAARNNAETLVSLFRSFLLYLSSTYPLKYRQPKFSIDEEQSQINALITLKQDFSLCRFHLKRAWRKHLVKKVPNSSRGKIATCLLRLLSTRNHDEYEKEYDALCTACGESGQHFLDYYNEVHHQYSKYWNSSDRSLRSNSLGSTNNVTETAIRLLEKDLHGKFKRFDNLIDHILKFFRHQQQKLMFPQIHRNDTVKQMEDRFEEGKNIVGENDVEECLEGPFVFKIKDYGINIQYCFCTCLDYLNNARICKHINACFIYFALKHELQDLPRNVFEFHDKIIGTLRRYQETLFEEETCVGSGRPMKVSTPARKFGRKKVDHRLITFTDGICHDRTELERVVGVARDQNGCVHYEVVWMDDHKQTWVPAEEMMSARLMVKQFLSEFEDFLDNFSSGQMNKRKVFSITKSRGVFYVEFFDSSEREVVSDDNAVPCMFFLTIFNT